MAPSTSIKEKRQTYRSKVLAMTTPGKITIHYKLSINREQIKKKNKLISKFTAHGESKINSIYKN